MNYLGIDYGTKRVGLSIGDDELGIAVSMEAISIAKWEEVVQQLVVIIELHQICKVIIGYPINMDDTIGSKAWEVDRFIDLLKRNILIPIERMDERLTSEYVGDLRRRSGKNRQNLRKSGAIDSAAAVLILQDYFDTLQMQRRQRGCV